MAGGCVYLRPAAAGDRDLLYQWRNDPACRENSLNQGTVPYGSHCAWFQERLGPGDCCIFICMEGGPPSGKPGLTTKAVMGK